jgi:fibronectin type 3 domain-containing protein
VTSIHSPGKPEIQFEGADTPPIKVFAHDVFPPAIPSGLQAAFSGAGQQPFIDLVWAPDTDADLAGYNVYRHEAGGESRKINKELVKTPAFRDSNVVAGHTYFYSVTAVDVRGNESEHSAEASEKVPEVGTSPKPGPDFRR